MRLTVKTLKGTHFEIRVQPSDTIMAVKRIIEEIQGKDNYAWGQQLIIHNGKVLKDETTLDENKVSEDSFLVVMLSKSKSSTTSGSSSGQASTNPAAKQPAPPPQEPTPPPPSQPPVSSEVSEALVQAASNIVPTTDLDPMVNQIMEMGGGIWDKETVLRALRAAYNNPERAVDYLYSGIPAGAEVAVPSGLGVNATGLPNVAPLNMFPQGGSPVAGAGGEAGSLDFLRNNQQFQALREMVQANPQILQPMLLELSKQNPDLLRLIQDNHAEFLQLLNEAAGEEDEEEVAEGEQFDLPEQEDMPHSVSVTPEDQDAIARLEGMGFERARVIEAFLACDRNEQLAANYLLEHAFDED